MLFYDYDKSLSENNARVLRMLRFLYTGPVVGRYCMDLAIEKAKKAGIGWVSARGRVEILNKFT